MSEEEKTIIDFLKKCRDNKDKMIPLLQRSNEILLNYIDKLNKSNEDLINRLNNIIYELRRYKSIVYLCEKVKDCDKN